MILWKRRWLFLFVLFLSLTMASSGCIAKSDSYTQQNNPKDISVEGGGEQMESDYDKIREQMMNEKKDKNNLKGFDESSGRQNIQVMLDDVPKYKKNCKSFCFKKEYSNFELAKLLENGADSGRYFAYYKHSDNLIEDGFNADISIVISDTVSEAHETLACFVDATTTMVLYPASNKEIFVGDLAVGNQDRLVFVRGNAYVDVKGYEVSIIDLAQEIDKQILSILNE